MLRGPGEQSEAGAEDGKSKPVVPAALSPLWPAWWLPARAHVAAGALVPTREQEQERVSCLLAAQQTEFCRWGRGLEKSPVSNLARCSPPRPWPG